MQHPVAIVRRAAVALGLVVAALAACEGNSPLERHADRFLREGGDGIFGQTGVTQNLTFPDASGLVHVRVRNLQGDVRIRGSRREAQGETMVRLRPNSEVDSGFAATTQLDTMKWDAQM
ncbi:MAG: hypothetical protein ACKPEA_19385, partial [Planctomycetota bacterium]